MWSSTLLFNAIFYVYDFYERKIPNMKEKTIQLQNKTILITGAAGFIGSNLVLELVRTQSPIHIVGIDNMNDYYASGICVDIYKRIDCR